MGAAEEVDLPSTAPGETADITVPTTAPEAPGTYTGYWQMKGPDGEFFGTKATVVIKVKGEEAPPESEATPAPEEEAQPSAAIPWRKSAKLGTWDIRTRQIYREKAVYFYDESLIAQGVYVIIGIGATNLSPGSDYLGRTVDFHVYDDQDRKWYRHDVIGSAEGYARWQYGGWDSLYSDALPGQELGILMVFDVAEDVEEDVDFLWLAAEHEDGDSVIFELKLFNPISQAAPVPESTPAEIPTPTATSGCDPSYPDVCIPSPPPNLSCPDIPHRNFLVLPPDPHDFDRDGDGIGCEE